MFAIMHVYSFKPYIVDEIISLPSNSGFNVQTFIPEHVNDKIINYVGYLYSIFEINLLI